MFFSSCRYYNFHLSLTLQTIKMTSVAINTDIYIWSNLTLLSQIKQALLFTHYFNKHY